MEKSVFKYRIEPSHVDFTSRASVSSMCDLILHAAGRDAHNRGFGIDYLAGKNIILPPDEAEAIKERIDKIATDFAIELVNQLHSKVPDFRTSAVIFSGGGALALKKYLEKTKAFSLTCYIEEINANAVGYQQIAKMQLGIE